MNLSIEIMEFIINPVPNKGEERPVSFLLYKEDFLKGIAYIIANLPLYKSSSTYSTKIEFSEGYFNELYSSVQEFFGDKPIQTYNVNIYRRSDSRIYLNSLRNGSFSIRNFLIEEISVLIFSKDSHGNNIIRLDIIDNLSENVKEDISQDLENPTARQIIYYGAPGTGKSHKIKEILGEYEGCPEDKKVPKANIFRTTFHPDSDYSSFVGAYKPTMKKQKDKIYTKGELISKLTEMKDGGVTYSPQKFGAKYWRSLKQLNLADKKDILQACGMSDNYTVELDKGIAVGEEYLTNSEESRIIYSFIPQTFLNAYIRAYQTDENVYLIIEEINRGNCAQIFGDLFQLLDRDGKGKSEYTIKADADLKTFLENELGEGCEAIKDGELCLPPNLYIYATMNTSDQSLFPIDSAFKRRWDWEYEPIKYKNTDWLIDIDGLKYRWSDFQKEVNTRILNDTGSEDKMLGDYFVNPPTRVISYNLFRNKILFYLWNDVCKDGDADIFPTNEEFSFSKLYDEDSKQLIISIMDKLELKPIPINGDNTEDEEGDDLLEGEDNNSSSIRYSINGEETDEKGKIWGKGALVKRAVEIFCQNNPDLSAEEVRDRWISVGFKIPHVVETEDDKQKRLNGSTDKTGRERCKPIKLRNEEVVYVSTEVGNDKVYNNFEDFLSKIKSRPEWGINIQEL